MTSQVSLYDDQPSMRQTIDRPTYRRNRAVPRSLFALCTDIVYYAHCFALSLAYLPVFDGSRPCLFSSMWLYVHVHLYCALFHMRDLVSGFFWEIRIEAIPRQIECTVWIRFTPHRQTHTHAHTERENESIYARRVSIHVCAVQSNCMYAQLCWCWFIYLFRTKRFTCACEWVSACGCVCVCVNAEERKNMGHRQVFVNAASGITHASNDYSHDMQASMNGIGIGVSVPHAHVWVWMECVCVRVYAVGDVSCVQILFAFISLSFPFCSLTHTFRSLIVAVDLPSWNFALTLNVILYRLFDIELCIILGVKLKSFHQESKQTKVTTSIWIFFWLCPPPRTHTHANTLNQNHTHTRRHEENSDSKKYDNWNAYLVMRYARNHIDLPFKWRQQPSHLWHLSKLASVFNRW